MALRTIKRLLFLGGIFYLGYCVRGCAEDCNGQTLSSTNQGYEANYTIESRFEQTSLLPASELEQELYQR